MRVFSDIVRAVYVLFLFFVISNTVCLDTINTSLIPEVYPKLFFTKRIHVVECSKMFNAEQEYWRSFACTLKSDESLYAPVSEKWDELKHIPECSIILSESPDVISGKYINYVQLGFQGGHVLGFYVLRSKNTFIVQNFDMEQVWRHEVQHHILNVLNIEDSHSHAVWSTCEPRYYTASKEVKETGSLYKKRNLLITEKLNIILFKLMGRDND